MITEISGGAVTAFEASKDMGMRFRRRRCIPSVGGHAFLQPTGRHRGRRPYCDGVGRAPALVVVPCYNEERRLDPARLGPLASSGRLQLLFVDDGSTDGTAAVLGRLETRWTASTFSPSRGTSGRRKPFAAVSSRAIETGAPIVGYYDADLATPPEELVRMVDLLENRPDLEFVMAARVALLGRHIRRRATRHYLGRVFATFASLTLHIPVYDTQCGAKVFRASPAVRAAVADPFRSSWVFDVELIGRLLRGTAGAEPVPLAAFEEMPLLEWRDVSGSRLRIRDMARAFADLLAVAIRLHPPNARRKD